MGANMEAMLSGDTLLTASQADDMEAVETTQSSVQEGGTEILALLFI